MAKGESTVDYLNEIGEYVKEQRSAQQSNLPWNPSSVSGNNTISFVRYKNVDIVLRLRRQYNFDNGCTIGGEVVEGKHDVVDINLYIKSEDTTVLQKFRDNENAFREVANGSALFLLDKGKRSGVLIRYFVPLEWNKWRDVGDVVRSRVSSLYNGVTNIISSFGNAIHGGIVKEKKGVKQKLNKCMDEFSLYNMIVFGAPGTGKSRYLKELLNKKYGELEDASERTEESYFADFDRVTFYPSYSYAQFVGSYKPYMAEVDKDGFEPQQGDARRRKVIAYKFEPGPFLRILVKAIKDPSRNYLLVIEEINRANAAAVFGDMFQLLDRCDGGQDGEKGCSEYDITPSEDVQKYLSENQVAETSKLRIPANLYIWATMNSADQGVFPLDTAFKRRWDFKYLSLDDKNGNDNVDVECGPGGLCKWGKLRKAINSLLARNRVNEDKHLSAYFVKPDGEDCISGERFKMKVLMYLWEDAARMCRTQIFNKNIKTFSELMRAWDSVKLSNVDAEGRTLGGDNPLESIFSFGTEKIERVVVTKDESSKDIDDAADEAGDEPIMSEEQDDATDQTSADVKTAEEAPSEDPQVVDDSKNTDAETPSPAEDEQKTPEGQGGATDKTSAEVKTAEEAPSEDSQAVDDPKNADAVAPNQEGNVQEKGDGQVQ